MDRVVAAGLLVVVVALALAAGLLLELGEQEKEAATTTTSITTATSNTSTAPGVTVVKREEPEPRPLCRLRVDEVLLEREKLVINLFNGNCTGARVRVDGLLDKVVWLGGAGSYTVTIALDRECTPGTMYTVRVEGLVGDETGYSVAWTAVCRD